MSYNGWTNYATWRVNLEMLGDLDLAEFFDEKPDLTDATDWCREYVDDYLASEVREASLVLDYARSFISDVNWREIAQHLLNDATFPTPDGDEE
jgi:hypothetical protein